MTDWRTLVPVEILEGQTVPEGVVALLRTLPVVVLGYHVLPEQTAPGQARMQFEERAQAALDEVAAGFRAVGPGADTRLVFTHDAEQTFDRVADEAGCEAILVPNPAGEVRRLLVPLRGEVDAERVAAYLAALVGDREFSITLYHVAPDDSEQSLAAGRALMETARERLLADGVATDAVREELAVSETPIRATGEAAAAHDAVVMGESAPSLRSFLFGEDAERVAAESLGPVVVVRRPRGGD